MNILYFVSAFFVSFVVCMYLVRYAYTHEHLTADDDLDGAQKFHAYAVPRVGGLALVVALLCNLPLIYFYDGASLGICFALLLLSALPAFAGGFAEDIFKVGLIKTRLMAMLLSCLLLVLLLRWTVVRVDIEMIDQALRLGWLAGLITVAAILGIINAFNLIDGYNGLSSAVAMIMLSSLAYVSFKVGDRVVMVAAIAMIGASLGFTLWNWPRGLIFLGDGGAYTLGFWLAALAIAIVMRNPGVSPWYACVLLLYPVVETVFTIHRRLDRKANPGMPDAAHLHQLIYKRMMRWAVGSSCPDERTMRNSMTSPYLWLFASLSVVPATLLWNSTLGLQITAFCFVIGYLWLYRCITRFKTPKWLVYRKISKNTKEV